MWMRDIVDLVHNKSVIIVGAGPDPKIPKNVCKDTTIICVKATGYVAKQLGLPDPNFTFGAEWALEDNLNLMKDLKTGTLLQVWRANGKEQWYRNVYKSVNYQFEKMYMFPDIRLATYYVTDIFKGENMPRDIFSYGISTLMICQMLRPKEVILVGYDPLNLSRSYESKREVLEVHSDIDAFLIEGFNRKFGNVYMCDKELAKKYNVNYKV